jgi:ABC-type phosphate transport system substrate-binding protein
VRSLIRLLVPLALSLSCAAAGAVDLVVVVSARSLMPPLHGEQVAAIFLGQSPRFPGGAQAVALDQSLGSPVRDAFYARVAAKSPALMKAHWSKMVFTGRGQPPREVPDSATVKKLVADDPALIGYIDRGMLDASVRAVLLVP